MTPTPSMPAPTPESSAATVKPRRGIDLSCLDMFIEEGEQKRSVRSGSGAGVIALDSLGSTLRHGYLAGLTVEGHMYADPSHRGPDSKVGST